MARASRQHLVALAGSHELWFRADPCVTRRATLELLGRPQEIVVGCGPGSPVLPRFLCSGDCGGEEASVEGLWLAETPSPLRGVDSSGRERA